MRRESEIFINRELSWLEFNRRVMDLSRAKYVPLAEQLNFAAIYGSNLDEFFMIRVGSLYDQTLLKSESKENKTGMTPQQQLDAIMPKVNELQKQCDKNVQKLFTRLERRGFRKVGLPTLDKEHLAFWKKLFLSELYPLLSPQIIGRRHPFPFLRNMDIYVGAMVLEKKNAEPVFALIPVSAQFERLFMVNEDGLQCYALVEELILQFADVVFGKGNVLSKCLFRITRNADINVEEGMFDHDIDYRVVMSELLKKRRKLAAVRLQFFGEPPAEIKNYLLPRIELPEAQCMWQESPLELSFLHTIYGWLQKLGKPRLFYPVARPIVPPPASDELYREVLQRDVLLCYPYQSMRPFIRMLHQAARDPDVISIKMTLYRVASESKVIEALISAAENGKEVVTIVELRARFDEQRNIDWSRRLEQAGCTVIYGFSEYKIHSKLTLITRRNGTRFEYITQIGTGNYNEKTSELYTDLAYITKNPVIGEEVASVFNNLAIERHTQRATNLIVAPLVFKSVLIDEILEEKRWHELGGESRVILKCNSISDKKVIETLSKASSSGVPIDMIVRGICCLQAGLPGLTENIKVRSIVGRYLEHSRIYAFGTEERLRIYIASGDFLTRNTERRVEVGVRVGDPAIQQTLMDILEMQLQDNVNAREMQPDGSYSWVKRGEDTPEMDSQMAMYPYLREKLHLLPVPAGAVPSAAPGPQGQERPEPREEPLKSPISHQGEEDTAVPSPAARPVTPASPEAQFPRQEEEEAEVSVPAAQPAAGVPPEAPEASAGAHTPDPVPQPAAPESLPAVPAAPETEHTSPEKATPQVPEPRAAASMEPGPPAWQASSQEQRAAGPERPQPTTEAPQSGQTAQAADGELPAPPPENWGRRLARRLWRIFRR